ncbi:MAG: polysaccharide deacetylase family protein [Vicinamibacterales bacterium]
MNLVTVDVEDWFHICGCGGPLAEEHWERLPSRVISTTERLLDCLDRAGVTATFFVVGWVAERFPQIVTRILGAGHEVGSHSARHRRVYELTREAFADDVRSSVRALETAGADAVRAFRAPEWSINDRAPWALGELVAQGFRVDASMAPLRIVGDINYPRHPHLRSTPRGAIVEVPPLVADRFGHVMPLGWGWGLRMSSPRRVLATMERANAQGWAAMLAVHPWELDPDPPRVRLSPRLHFSHYFCLAGFEARFQEVLKHGTFTTLGAIEQAVRSAADPCVFAA